MIRPPRPLLIATTVLWLASGDGRAPAAAPLVAQGAAARSVQAPARHVDRAELLRDVSTLGARAFEGRATGTPGGLRARQWIVERLAAIGVPAAQPSGYAQPFTVATRDVRAILPRGRPFAIERPAANIVGRLAGRDRGAGVIVITAHYDHLGMRDGVVYPGADDNASGVAVLLATARHFVRSPPRHSLILAALDAEEIGLHGAKSLIRSDLLPRGRVALNINLDMVSRSDKNEIYAAGTYHSPWEMPILQDVQRRASVRILFGHDRPGTQANRLEDWTRSSDHGAFHEVGMPFVYFGVEDHPDYHGPTDTAERIDPRFFGDAADMIVEAVRTFDAVLPSMP